MVKVKNSEDFNCRHNCSVIKRLLIQIPSNIKNNTPIRSPRLTFLWCQPNQLSTHTSFHHLYLTNKQNNILKITKSQEPLCQQTIEPKVNPNNPTD